MGQWASKTVPQEDPDEVLFRALILEQGPFVPTEDAVHGLDIQIRFAKCEKTMYFAHHNCGLFAGRNFKAGEIIICKEHPYTSGSNDAMMNLGPFIEASSAFAMEQAFIDARKKYYNYQDGDQRVNAVLIFSPETHREALKARRFIAKGEEILRVYGFSTWIKEIAELNLLTLRTLPGFFNYVVNVASKWRNDPFINYIDDVVRHIPAIVEKCYGNNAPVKKPGELLAASDEFDLLWKQKVFANIDDHVQFCFFKYSPSMDLVIGHEKSKYIRSLTETRDMVRQLFK